MNMSVRQAGKHCFAIQVDFDRIGPGQAAHLAVVTQSGNAPISRRQRSGFRHPGVERDNVTVEKNHINQSSSSLTAP